MDNNHNPKNLLWLSPVLVLLVIGLCVALSMVPDRYWMRDVRGNQLKVFGQALKKPDMMSMFRETEGAGGDASEPDSTGDYLASMRRRPDAHKGSYGEGAAGRGGVGRGGENGPEAYVPGQAGDSSAAAAAARAAADTNFHSVAIEDFTPQHIALSRFYAKLENARKGNLGRPLHIAFLGDSFIEGDILVADLRSGLQREYGGGGVGFVPVATEVDQYRATVKMKSGGWKSYSILYDRHQAYTLPGMVFEASVPNPTIEVSATRSYPNILKHATIGVISEGKPQYEIYFSTKDTSYVRHVDVGGGDRIGTERMDEVGLWRENLVSLSELLGDTTFRQGEAVPPAVRYHRPCHGAGGNQDLSMLRRIMGDRIIFRENETPCCGFGGLTKLTSPELSEAVAARALAIYAPGPDDQIVTGCSGCVTQLRSAAPEGVYVAHWLELIG